MGTHRRRDYPMGMAARGYFSSPRSDDSYMESQLDIRDANGDSMPGYGWVFPLGDGTVNVGVGLLSTFRQWKSINTSDMMAAYVDSAPDYWELSPAAALSKPRGGKLSMALSVGPYAGSNWVLVGDAVGAINPWNGEGIAYAYETGRMAADHVHQALASDDLGLLQRYPQDLEDTYGLYYRMARIFVKAIGYPQVMWTLAHVGLAIETLDGVGAESDVESAGARGPPHRRAGVSPAGAHGADGAVAAPGSRRRLAFRFGSEP